MQFKFILLNVFIIYLFILNLYFLTFYCKITFDKFDCIEFVGYIDTILTFIKNNHKFIENSKHNMSLRYLSSNKF